MKRLLTISLHSTFHIPTNGCVTISSAGTAPLDPALLISPSISLHPLHSTPLHSTPLHSTPPLQLYLHLTHHLPLASSTHAAHSRLTVIGCINAASTQLIKTTPTSLRPCHFPLPALTWLVFPLKGLMTTKQVPYGPSSFFSS